MNAKKLKVVHYLNQFFGQEGQEDKADIQFLIKKGPIGPGVGLQKILGERGEVVATVICGDNYFAENLDSAAERGVEIIDSFQPDILFAGPAFEAGRYGMACGALCEAVQKKLGILAITGMFEENPGVEVYRRDVYICRTIKSTAKMFEDLTHMVNLALKLISEERGSRLVSGENVGRPLEDGYFPRGMLRNEYTEKTTAERGVDMLLAKIKGMPFQTEAEGPTVQIVQPPPPIKDLAKCEIVLISDGGLAPKGNPDRFSTRGNKIWATYEIEQLFPQDRSSDFDIFHTGYHPAYIMENPNRLVPVDVMRDLGKEGVIGKLHPAFYSTSGNTTTEVECRKMGEGIAEQLKKTGINGAILTSTWGTSTRCGATIASEIEKSGLPIVNVTAVPTISKMVGVTRILRGVSVTNLLGDTKLTKEREKVLRRKYVLRALEILQTDVKNSQIFTVEGKE